MINFKIELIDALEKAIEWSAKFEGGLKDYSFDIDNMLFRISENYHKDFKKGNLFLIYNLVDYFCDAVKHDFKEIDERYSVIEAKNDIIFIINHLKSCIDIQLPQKLENKLKTVFTPKKNKPTISIIGFFRKILHRNQNLILLFL